LLFCFNYSKSHTSSFQHSLCSYNYSSIKNMNCCIGSLFILIKTI
jgi:hypothetical protein